jgi:hypothetical protein
LPSIITFNPKKMSFKVFTRLPRFAKTYLIKIHGTTEYFNQTESTNVVMLQLDVKCITLVLSADK